MNLHAAIGRTAIAFSLLLISAVALAQQTGTCNGRLGSSIVLVQLDDHLTPDGATAPFESWSRGDAGSTYVSWTEFAVGYQGTNSPYVCPALDADTTFDLPPGGFATVEQLTAPTSSGAFIASSGNIYSFAIPLSIEVVVDGRYAATAFGQDTRIVAQIGTVGTEADPLTYLLTFTGPDGQTMSLAPDSITELVSEPSSSSFGGNRVADLLQWDLAGFVPDAYTITFQALGSSMGLDVVTIDAFSQPLALIGDLDRDNDVDADDYTGWATAYGATNLSGLAADANGDGVINAADYTVWRDASAPSAQAVPEPNMGTLAAAGLLTASFCFGVRCVTTGGREPNE